MYQALYRKWRPRTFDEMIGQDSISSLLKRQAAEDKVSHAYLFAGTRGTGKTTSAKVLAKAVNCLSPKDGNPCGECFACRSIDDGSATDVLEIDAASNNRVDDVRELIDEVVYPPSTLKKRVYIIDEVHMLTDSAFNALLKTLEEPPEYVLFILATTELNELPATIVSRCMRFDFKRIEPEALAARCRYVASQEGIKITDEALQLIAKLADGAMRDALSLLDACSAWKGSESEVTIDDVREQLGISNNDSLIALFEAIRSRNVHDALEVVEKIHGGSSDPSVFLEDMIGFVRDCLIAKSSDKKEQYLKKQFFFSSAAFERIPALLSTLTSETLFYYASVLEDTLASFSKFTIDKKTLLDMAVIKMCDPSMSVSVKAVSARLSELERKIAALASGVVLSAPAAPKVTESVPNEPKADEVQRPATAKTPYGGYAEIRDMLAGEPATAALFGKCRVYQTDSGLLIEGDQFTVTRLQSESCIGTLRASIAAVAGNVQISFGVKKLADTKSDPFNDINTEE